VAVKIRLMRVGKKKQPTYRVVVADGRSPRDGRFLDIIGKYAPRQDPSLVEIDADSALAWLRNGAQPTEQVQKLLAVTGVWAQYESDRTRPAQTKLARRGFSTGRVGAASKGAPAPRPAAAASEPRPPQPEAEEAGTAQPPGAGQGADT
jgi:small subunit ribosomal protein S16